MTEKLFDKLVENMAAHCAGALCTEAVFDLEIVHNIPRDIFLTKWNKHNNELTKWFKDLRNVDINKFDEFVHTNDFKLCDCISDIVDQEVDKMFCQSENDMDYYYTYFSEETSFFDPFSYFNDEELNEFDEFVSENKDNPDTQWFKQIIFDKVLDKIETIWYFDNLMRMNENEIKDLIF